MKFVCALLVLVAVGCGDSHRSKASPVKAPGDTHDAGSAAADPDAEGGSSSSDPDAASPAEATPDAGSAPDAPERPAAGGGGSKQPARAPSAAEHAEDAGVMPPSSAAGSFSLEQPLEVEITLADADWDKLRREGRSLPSVAAGCEDPAFSDYTSFSGTVRVQGERLTGVEVHKKGFLGSLSMFRPSLVLDFGEDERGKDRSLHGFERLTLNNNRQDKTNARQCLAYALFERAGLHAPRCGLAHVTLNGQDLGYYTHLEPIKKPFLSRSFGRKDGNLYELDTPTDFTAASKSRFELKGGAAGADTSDLDRLFAALQLPDDQLIAALEPLLALDEYLSLWAMEALLGQWDGMSGNGNNSFVYRDPRDGRFHPIPWGADAAFGSTHSLFPSDTALSVFTSTLISKRLHALPEWRAKYQSRLRQLLADVWKEPELVAQLHAISDKTAAPAAVTASVEKFITGQRALIEAELDNAQPPRPLALARDTQCLPMTPASSSMDFTWSAEKRAGSSTADPLGALPEFKGVQGGAIEMDIRLADTPLELWPGAQLGVAGLTGDDSVFIGVMGFDARTFDATYVGVIMPLANYHAGTVEFHGFETFGIVARSDGTSMRSEACIGAGTIRFAEAGRNTGDPVRGTWQGTLAPMPLKALAP